MECFTETHLQPTARCACTWAVLLVVVALFRPLIEGSPTACFSFPVLVYSILASLFAYEGMAGRNPLAFVQSVFMEYF